MSFPRPDAWFDRLALYLPELPAWSLRLVAALGLFGAAFALAWYRPWVGAGLWLLGVMADGAGQAVLRRTEGAARPLIDTIPLLPLGLLTLPFGFALAMPERALAAMLLLFSLALLAAFSGPRTRLIHWLGALVALAACLLPDRFSILAYLLAIACFVKTGQVAAERS